MTVALRQAWDNALARLGMDPIGNQFFCHGLFAPKPKRHARAFRKTGGDGDRTD